jgi:hypothetical protein
MPPSPKTKCEILQSANFKVFSFEDVRLATRNFRPDSLLGEGGFGSVYKGWIDVHTLSACRPGTGMPVAVKKLNKEVLQVKQQEWLVSLTGVPFLFAVIIDVLFDSCFFEVYFCTSYLYVTSLNPLVTTSDVLIKHLDIFLTFYASIYR